MPSKPESELTSEGREEEGDEEEEGGERVQRKTLNLSRCVGIYIMPVDL